MPLNNIYKVFLFMFCVQIFCNIDYFASYVAAICKKVVPHLLSLSLFFNITHVCKFLDGAYTNIAGFF